MIFFSYYEKDEEWVTPIADELGSFFDREHFVFDTWSKQPGETVQEELDAPRDQMGTFFLFLTEESMDTDLSEFEWLSELRTRSQLQVIPIRVENFRIPKEFSSLRYLDLHEDGMELVTTQMAEIIGKENAKKDFENLQGYVVTEDDNNFSFYVVAKEFYEKQSTFLIVTDYEQDELDINIPGESQLMQKFYPDMEVEDYGPADEEMTVNGFLIGSPKGLVKGDPLEITVRRLKSDGEFVDLHHVKTTSDLPKIDLKFVEDLAEMQEDL